MKTTHDSALFFENATNVAVAISKGGRDGTLRSADRPEASSLIDPAQKPNPELLFAGALAACFHSAMIGAAKADGTTITDTEVHARVGLQKHAAGDSRLVVELRAKLPGVDNVKGRELMEAAHKACPYSKALRGEATVGLVVDSD